MIDIIKQINHNILNNNFTEDIAWQSLKGQSLNVFNVREILEFHQRGHKVQNTVIQNANMNIGLASILREVLLKRTVNFVKRNLILSNHKTIATVLMNVLARPKVSMRKGFVLIAENLLKLRGLLQIFVVPGNVELLVREHLIGRHEQKNLRNVNNAEKNFGLDKIGLRSEKANSVLKNVFQNLNREHLIGRHEQKNLRNVNNAEKNFGLDKIGLRSEKANSVLKNVFQNLNRFSMQ